MDDRLKSAESSIAFLQNEHERVLHGLHMEIERLQQKCSGKFSSSITIFNTKNFDKKSVGLLVVFFSLKSYLFENWHQHEFSICFLPKFEF